MPPAAFLAGARKALGSSADERFWQPELSRSPELDER
jgi:hypothetical protein